MSFLNASCSFTRLRLIEPVPQSLWPEVPDRLRKYAFKDIDELPEMRSFGWVSFDDMLDTEFATTPVEVAEYILFSLRLDTRRIPPAVQKKYYALALRQEEQQAKEQGRNYISRDRKKELKEQVALKLRMRFLPIPSYFQVVWNTSSSMIYFASAQTKMVDMFQELFTLTFDLHLEPMTPYEMALTTLPDAAALDSFEPTQFA